MATEPVRSEAVVAAPKDYSIPHAQEIILRSVTASFIDNGAAGDWLPAVVILDNNGNPLCRAVDQGVKVTAGSDAEVSWFPGVKHAASGGSDFNDLDLASATLWLDVANNGDTQFTVNAGATVPITFRHGNFDGVAFNSPSLDTLTMLIRSDFGASGVHSAQYWWTLSVLWEDANFARSAIITMPLDQGAAPVGPQYADFHSNTGDNTFTTSNPSGLGVQWCRDFAFALPRTANLPVAVQAIVHNADASARHVTAAYLTGYCSFFDSAS